MSSTVLIADLNGINSVNVNAIERELNTNLKKGKYTVERLSTHKDPASIQSAAAFFLVDGNVFNMLGSLSNLKLRFRILKSEHTAFYFAGGGLLACTEKYLSPNSSPTQKSSIMYSRFSKWDFNRFLTVGPCFEKMPKLPSGRNFGILKVNRHDRHDDSGYVFSSHRTAFKVDDASYVLDSYEFDDQLHSTVSFHYNKEYKRIFTGIHPELHGEDVNQIFKECGLSAPTELVRQIEDSTEFRQKLFRRNLEWLGLELESEVD